MSFVLTYAEYSNGRERDAEKTFSTLEEAERFVIDELHGEQRVEQENIVKFQTPVPRSFRYNTVWIAQKD